MSDRVVGSNAIPNPSPAGSDAGSGAKGKFKPRPTRLSSSQWARRSARLVGKLFSGNQANGDEVALGGYHVMRTVECVTGGHGRCTSNACPCHCHGA